MLVLVLVPRSSTSMKTAIVAIALTTSKIIIAMVVQRFLHYVGGFLLLYDDIIVLA